MDVLMWYYILLTAFSMVTALYFFTKNKELKKKLELAKSLLDLQSAISQTLTADWIRLKEETKENEDSERIDEN